MYDSAALLYTCSVFRTVNGTSLWQVFPGCLYNAVLFPTVTTMQFVGSVLLGLKFFLTYFFGWCTKHYTPVMYLRVTVLDGDHFEEAHELLFRGITERSEVFCSVSHMTSLTSSSALIEHINETYITSHVKTNMWAVAWHVRSFCQLGADTAHWGSIVFY